MLFEKVLPEQINQALVVLIALLLDGYAVEVYPGGSAWDSFQAHPLVLSPPFHDTRKTVGD